MPRSDPMCAALLAETNSHTGFSWWGLLIVLIVFAVVYPLQARLRKSLSERRRRRWAEQEGTVPRSSDPSQDDD